MPAVVHADGSSRVHTATEALSPNYYRLLTEFGKKTGISVLLNTSFNTKGMPIVETPADALAFFMECALDVLVLDGYIVEKISTEEVDKESEKDEWEQG